MMEIKVTVVLPGIPEAINNLASAISKQAAMLNTTEPVIPAAPNNEPAQVLPAQTMPAPTVQETATPTQAPAQMGSANTAMTAPVQTATVPPTESAATIPQPSPELNPTPVPTKKYTREEIANAGSALVTQGKMNDLLALLKKYSVQSVAHLPEDQYGAFAEDLKALGAAL